MLCVPTAYGRIMWKKRDILRAGAAIIVTMVGWGLIRLIFPALDYYPPESITRVLEPSWVATAGLRKAAMFVYGLLALVLMAGFFKPVQERWPGRGAVKGLVFGTALGVIWSFGFLGGWAFLGTTLRAELLNSVVDALPLGVAGWLIGVAVGRDAPKSEHEMSKPWLAVVLVAIGFVVVHALGATFFAELVGPASPLLFVPTTPRQFALLAALGVWVGGMYVVLHAGLPFESTWARAAFFGFGVFGHSWTWFHLFIPIMDVAGALSVGLLVGLIGAVGVFVGALGYGWLARAAQPSQTSETAGILVPPPVPLVVALVLGLVLDSAIPADLPLEAPLWARSIGAAAGIAAGVLLIASAYRGFRRAGVDADPYRPTSGIISSGLYKHSRNPMYVGLILFYAGLAALFGGLWCWLLLPVAVLVLDFGVVRQEEAYLERRFGEAYRTYRNQVRRWL